MKFPVGDDSPGELEPSFPIVYEDAELLVINKPADLVCHPTKGDAYSSLIGRVRIYLGPEVRAQLINRLDRETSGLVLVAKTASSALELRKLWERRDVQKTYLAIVHGHPRQARDVIDAPTGKDEQSMVAIKDTVRPDGSPARTAYAVLRTFTREFRTPGKSELAKSPSQLPFSLLQVSPLTGRKHQIRIHLAHVGHPIVGDKLYGGDERIYLDFVQKRITDSQRERMILPNHALHAEQVQFEWRGKPWSLRASPEPWFMNFASESGVEPSLSGW